MIIPHDQLDPQTLQAVIEEFVTRHGAVHGHNETSLEQMVRTVLQQLRTGRAVVVFDEEEETCSIMSKQEANEAGEQAVRDESWVDREGEIRGD